MQQKKKKKSYEGDRFKKNKTTSKPRLWLDR